MAGQNGGAIPEGRLPITAQEATLWGFAFLVTTFLPLAAHGIRFEINPGFQQEKREITVK
ncbi:MAG: hypothetical protein U0V70_04430 [Terriglobia bacterium]